MKQIWEEVFLQQTKQQQQGPTMEGDQLDVMASLQSNHACYGGGKWTGNFGHYLKEEGEGEWEEVDDEKDISFLL